GHRGRFTGLRLRCGDWRAAAEGCHRASLMIRRAAAATVRPCVRPDPGSPPSSFPQVTSLDRSGGPVLPPLSACEMRARQALVVLAWSGDGLGHPGNLGGHETWEDAGSWRYSENTRMSC